MTCRDMDGIMSSHSGNSLLPPEAAEHIVGCERCRCLVRLLHETSEIPTPSESHLKRIQKGILENLRPVRPLPPSRIFLFSFALIFLSVVAVGAMRLGMNGWSVLSMEQKIAVFATLAASAVLLALSMVRQMVPGSKHAVSPTTLPIAILLVLILVIAAVFRSEEESAFVTTGLMCMRNGLAYSIPTAFLFWMLLRRGAILYPRLIGAAAGGFAGLIGLSVLEINCPNLNEYHILVWHWGVILITALAGVALGAAVEYIERRSNHRIVR
jgi:hypothetical protein